MTSLLSHLSIPFERFNAVLGKELLPDDQRLKDFNQVHLRTNSEIGCFLSHLTLWKKVAESSTINSALILEDDIMTYISEKDLKERLRSAYSLPFDALYLGKCSDKCSAHEETTIPFLFRSFRPMCLHSYILTKKAAKLLISNKPFDFAVDHFLSCLIEQKKLTAYAFHPSIFIQNTTLFESSLRKSTNTNTNECENITDPRAMASSTANFFLQKGDLLIVIFFLALVMLLIVMLFKHQVYIRV